MNKNILIIDKEFDDYHLLKERLEQLYFIVHTSIDIQEGLDKILKLNPILIICNFHIFHFSEKQFNEKIIHYTKSIPIIVTNCSKTEDEVLLSFEKGATEYITKPFNSRELEARIKAILRRIEMTKSNEEIEIKIGNLILNPGHYEVSLPTHKVNLSKKEQELFLLLINRKIISREELIRHLWGFDYYGGSRIVDVNISNIRRKIETNPKKPQYIKTIKGYGYRLDEPIFKEG